MMLPMTAHRSSLSNRAGSPPVVDFSHHHHWAIPEQIELVRYFGHALDDTNRGLRAERVEVVLIVTLEQMRSAELCLVTEMINALYSRVALTSSEVDDRARPEPEGRRLRFSITASPCCRWDGLSCRNSNFIPD